MTSKLRMISICTVGLLLAGACQRDKADGSKEGPSVASTSQHAASGVEPGSHEDWCGEHGVPESLCTRCNASLIPAFKATGDWCEEHGLPESQCLRCNPELQIERPPRKKAN